VSPESSKNGAIAMTSMNFSGYVGHVTIQLNAYYLLHMVRVRFMDMILFLCLV